MALQIKQHPNRPAGYAWFEIAAALPEGPTTFRIEREHETTPHLGPGGWQASPSDLTPREVQYTDTGLLIIVGPDVVNHVYEDERIRVFLPAIGYEADGVWPGIPHLRTGGKSIVGAPPPKPVDPGPVVLVRQEPEPAPSTKPDPKPDPDPSTSVADPASAPLRRGPRPAIVASAIALLALIAGGGAYLGLSLRDKEPITVTQASTQDEPNAETLIMDPNTDPRRLYDLGLKLEQDKSPRTDLAFEAIFRAAQRGIPEAALWIGRAYDPRYENWRRILGDRPDPSSALRHYRLSEQGGASQARDETAGLCAWLEPKQRGGTDAERLAFEEACRS